MSGPSTHSGRAVENIDKGKEVEHTLDDDNNNPMGSFNTNPQSDPSTADNTSSNTQTQLEVMRNHIARLKQQKEELMHKLEESKVERQMLDNSEDNEGQNEQRLDEEDEEPRSSHDLSAQTSYPEVKREYSWQRTSVPPSRAQGPKISQPEYYHGQYAKLSTFITQVTMVIYPSTLSLPYRDLQSPIRQVVPQRHPILMVPTLCNHRSPAQVYAGLQEILCQVKEEFWGSRWGTDCGMTTKHCSSAGFCILIPHNFYAVCHLGSVEWWSKEGLLLQGLEGWHQRWTRQTTQSQVIQEPPRHGNPYQQPSIWTGISKARPTAKGAFQCHPKWLHLHLLQ